MLLYEMHYILHRHLAGIISIKPVNLSRKKVYILGISNIFSTQLNSAYHQKHGSRLETIYDMYNLQKYGYGLFIHL